MCVKRDTVRDRFERSKATPDRHQQEERQVNQCSDLRHQVKDVRRRLRTQVAKHDKVDKEDTVQNFVPVWAITNRLYRAVVKPRQKKQQDDGAAHRDHAPELCVDRAQQDGNNDQHDWNDEFGEAFGLEEHDNRSQYRRARKDPGEVVGCCTQHRVERREIPDRGNMKRCLEWIGWQEVIELQEVPTHLRGKEDNRHEDNEEARHTQNIMNSIEGVERNAIQRATMLVFFSFYIDPVGVV